MLSSVGWNSFLHPGSSERRSLILFAALTAIFAKVGVEQVNLDFATFIRTLVVVAVLAVTFLQQDNGKVFARFRLEVIARPLI